MEQEKKITPEQVVDLTSATLYYVAFEDPTASNYLKRRALQAADLIGKPRLRNYRYNPDAGMVEIIKEKRS